MAQSGLIAQLRSIATAVEVLPEVRDAMIRMNDNVETMVGEVTKMRHGVEALAVEVEDLNKHVQPLDGRFVEMLEDIRGLERHLKEVRASLQPLQRAVGGIGNLGVRLRGNRQAAE